jgi:chromosome segregation ATPase
MRGGEQVIPHLAAGGPVKAAEFGSSTKYSVAAVVALIRAIQDPTRDLAKFTASVKGATLANKAAQAELRRPKSTLDRATRDYNRAVNQRNNLRLTNARQTNAARSRVATASAQVKAAELALDKMEPKSEKIRKAQSALVSAQKSLDSKRRSAAEAIAKIEDKIRNTKRGTTQYQNLLTEKSLKQKSNARAIAAAEDKVHAARKAAAKAGVNTDKIAAAQRRLTKAENELTRARAHQSKVSRDNALQTAEASAKVAKAEKAKKQATDAYNRASDRAKAKAQALKDAQQRLAEQQQAVADSAKQLSESFSDLYNQPTGTLTDLFKSMKQGTSDLTLFRKDLDRLRKMGLSESVIDQIVNQAQSGGVQSGITLANQAIGGGTYFINQLNKAAQQLKDASDILGYKTASAKGTGYASGTDWATPGIHDVSENKVEVVVGRQARRFMGGEMVKNLANLGRPAAPVMVAENQPSAELHIHFDRVTDVHSAAREFEDIMRKDTRWKGGVKIGLRTRGNQ